MCTSSMQTLQGQGVINISTICTHCKTDTQYNKTSIHNRHGCSGRLRISRSTCNNVVQVQYLFTLNGRCLVSKIKFQEVFILYSPAFVSEGFLCLI